MKMTSRVALAGALLLLLTGCTSDNEVEAAPEKAPSSEETSASAETAQPAGPPVSDLDPCPRAEILVEDLMAIGDPGCDLAGTVMVFPDGFEQELQPVTASWGGSQYDVDTPEDVVHYQLKNFGATGVGAMRQATGEQPEHWATSETTLRRTKALLQQGEVER